VSLQQQGRTTVRLFSTASHVPTWKQPSWLGPDPQGEAQGPIPTCAPDKRLVEAVFDGGVAPLSTGGHRRQSGGSRVQPMPGPQGRRHGRGNGRLDLAAQAPLR